MKDKILLAVNPDGSTVAIYDDSLADLLMKGVTTRASNVEPCKKGGWHAIMIPNPPEYPDELHLGPFKLRREALAAEVEELERRLYG